MSSIRRLIAIWPTAFALAACGGSGGGGGLTVVPAPTPSPIPSPTPTPTPTTPDTASLFTPAAAAKPATGAALPLGKCINMGNMLELQNEGGSGRKILDSDFSNIRSAGFSTVRIPVLFSGHAGANAPYTIDTTFMARVRHVADAALGAGLNVIIDMHGYDAISEDPSGQTDRFVALWRQIGTEFSDEPTNLWFELLNEPKDRLTSSNLPTILGKALAAVRETNPTRIAIIGGGNTSNIDSLATIGFPDDPNIVPTFHYYAPMDFTHQGASWISPTPPLGATFGSDADIATLRANLSKVTSFMTRTGRVPFVGEYGVYDLPAIPVAQRINYYGTVSTAMASIGVQSCAWAYLNTFRLYDGSRWIPGMLDAIKGTTTIR